MAAGPVSPPPGAAFLADKAVASIAQHDWKTFYSVLAPEAQAGFKSEQEFATVAESANRNVISAQLTGFPSNSSSATYYYYSQSVSLQLKDSSGVKAYRTKLYLVYKSGKWYVLGTDPPSPAP